MNVVRSTAQPELIHVVLTDGDAASLVRALRKPKNEVADVLRRKLKKVLR